MKNIQRDGLKFFLASDSKRRQQLLKQMNINFKVIPCKILEENFLKNKNNPKEIVKKIAVLKAEEVAKNIDDGIIISADTIIYCGKEIIGKPKNKKDAYKILKKLSGKTHKVITGLAVIKKENSIKVIKKVAAVITEVMMKKLMNNEIKNYIETGEPLGKAGAYAIQGRGAIFIKGIKGCYFNVVGLPLFKLNTMLKNLQ